MKKILRRGKWEEDDKESEKGEGRRKTVEDKEDIWLKVRRGTE